MPQPYLVPVNPSCSRNTHSNGVSGSASTIAARPLTLSLIIGASCEGKTGARDRKRADPLSGCKVNRIADRSWHRNRAELSRTSGFVLAWDEMDLDRWRLPQVQRLER